MTLTSQRGLKLSDERIEARLVLASFLSFLSFFLSPMTSASASASVVVAALLDLLPPVKYA
jgi:hypothetical protein